MSDKKLLKVVEIVNDKPEKEEKFDASNYGGIGTLMKNPPPKINPYLIAIDDDKPKRGRPKKIVSQSTESQINKQIQTPLNSDMPYFKTYTVPTQILTQTVMQIEDLTKKIEDDLAMVRRAPNMRGKYTYICNLSDTLGNLYSNKIQAAREIANGITNSHKLELAKVKELKVGEQESDEKRLMDYFNAFMHTPMASVPMAARPVPPEALNSLNPNSPSSISGDDSGYNQFLSNLSPEENAILQEGNPHIQTILVYDQSTNNKWFEIIDDRTGEPVPNMPLPPEFIAKGCTIDINNGVARNADINKTYKLKLVGVSNSFNNF